MLQAIFTLRRKGFNKKSKLEKYLTIKMKKGGKYQWEEV